MASIIRGDDNFDSFESSGLGVNQTWQDVTADRAEGVTYTNTTGRPIYVSVYFFFTNDGSFLEPSLHIDGFNMSSGVNDIISNSFFTLGGIVPNGSTYEFFNYTNSSDTIFEVRELR